MGSLVAHFQAAIQMLPDIDPGQAAAARLQVVCARLNGDQLGCPEGYRSDPDSVGLQRQLDLIPP